MSAREETVETESFIVYPLLSFSLSKPRISTFLWWWGTMEGILTKHLKGKIVEPE
jgi:hypothetical protein